MRPPFARDLALRCKGASPHRRFGGWFDWRTALLCAVVAIVVGAAQSWPTLPRVLALQITFPRGQPGTSEPLIETGRREDGDLLVLKYESADQLVLAYDSWGVGGPHSSVVSYRPGGTHRLDVEMPALSEISQVFGRKRAPLRVRLDGREILQAEVPFHVRGSGEFYFGVNAIDGSTGARFSGTLRGPGGQVLAGGPSTWFSRLQRITGLLLDPARMSGVLLLGLAAGFLGAGCRRGFATGASNTESAQDAPHAWFWATAAVALILFTYVVTAGSFHLLYPDWFGYYYDYHARGLLHGRLDVPEEGISGEAFVHGGKFYGYFGPTPALMRIPFVLLDVGFARLTRIFMIFDYALSLVGVYFILCQVVRMTDRLRRWPSRWAVVVFVGTTALGSTLFFLGSRVYVYDEAILCGAAFALWSAYCALRYLEIPEMRWWLGALICGTFSVHARPPVGFYALVFLGVAAATNLFRAWRNDSVAPPGRVAGIRRHVAIGSLALLGVLSFNGLSYLKFGTIEGCPLRMNVQYDAKRLARIDGKEFHVGNIRFGLDAYVLRPTLRFDRHFPFLAAKAPPSGEYPGAKLDLTEPIAGLPYAMPALCLLALIGLACTRSRDAAAAATIVAWFAVIPAAVAMFAAIAVSHRYTGDFVPFLVIAAAFGMARIDAGRSAFARLSRSAVGVASLASIAITLALTLRTQAEAFGTPPAALQRYITWQQRIDTWFGADRLH